MSSTAETLSRPSAKWRIQMLMLVGIFAGSWASIFGRIAQHEGVPTPVIIAFRMTLGAVLLTPYVLRNHMAEIKLITRRQILFAMLSGFLLAIHLMTGFASLEHTTVLISTVLTGTSPLWIALIESTVFKTRLSSLVWLGLTVTLIGGVIISVSGGMDLSLGNNPHLGILLAIFAAIASAFYSLMGRQSRHGVPFMLYLWLLFAFGGLVALITSASIQAPLTGYSDKAYFSLIMLTLLPQLISHTIYNYTLRRLSATYVSVVGQLNIIGSSALALLLLNEVPTPLQLPGSIAVILGITLVNLGKIKPDKQEDSLISQSSLKPR